MRLDDDSVGVLKKQKIAFRQKFGREPGPNDPIFFDPDSDEPRPISEVDFAEASVEAMRLAGIDPSFIYAFEKTGMLVSEGNIEKWSADDIDEWNAAVEEYHEAHRKE